MSKEEHYYYGTKIISSIDECVLFILLIFNIRQAHCSDIIQTLRIELILTCMFYTCTYIFPFFHEEDTQSIPCRLQSLLFTSSSIATAINVFTLSFLNMKLFTHKVLYEKKNLSNLLSPLYNFLYNSFHCVFLFGVLEK